MRLIFVVLMVFVAALWAADEDAGYAAAVQAKPAEAARQFGDAGVSRVVQVGEGFSFVCCVDEWPDVVGRDVAVIIGKIEMPGALGAEGKNFYDKQLAKYLQERLAGGKVELCNITRAADRFALVADVKVDGRYLAAELIKQGFAKAIEPPAMPAPTQQYRDQKGAGEPQTTADRGQSPPATPQQPSDPKEAAKPADAADPAIAAAFMGSKNSDLFHKIDCSSAKRITEKNAVYFKTAKEAAAAGKKPCSRCKPGEGE